MMDMEKDEQLQQVFGEYFEGNGMPQCDLSAAKRALFEEKVRRKRRRTLISVLSSCAALVLVGVLAFTLLPSFFAGEKAEGGVAGDGMNSGAASAPDRPPVSDAEAPTEAVPLSYSLADTASRSTDYAELSTQYALFGQFVSFDVAANATCQYFVHSYEGKDVLVRAEITITSGSARIFATVYTDLTEGGYAAEDFSGYKSLQFQGGYRMETEYLNGEYVSRSYWVQGADRFAEVTSPSSEGAGLLMDYFLK